MKSTTKASSSKAAQHKSTCQKPAHSDIKEVSDSDEPHQQVGRAKQHCIENTVDKEDIKEEVEDDMGDGDEQVIADNEQDVSMFHFLRKVSYSSVLG